MQYTWVVQQTTGTMNQERFLIKLTEDGELRKKLIKLMDRGDINDMSYVFLVCDKHFEEKYLKINKIVFDW